MAHWTIDNYNKLTLLNSGDTIYFPGCLVNYEVHDSYIATSDYEQMPELFIFKLLNIDSWSFCEGSYGYEPNDAGEGLWPETDDSDFEALTRCVRYLFDIYVEKEIENNTFKLTLECVNIKMF